MAIKGWADFIWPATRLTRRRWQRCGHVNSVRETAGGDDPQPTAFRSRCKHGCARLPRPIVLIPKARLPTFPDDIAPGLIASV